MGLFSFAVSAGAKLFGKKVAAAPVEEKSSLKAATLLEFVQKLELPFKRLKISLKGDDVVLEGEVENQEDAEKIVLAVGNVEGVDTVDNQITVVDAKPEAKFYTVVAGDSLSKIALKYYHSANKYPVIFEANKPMLTHPDKIYPGQVLRIPNIE